MELTIGRYYACEYCPGKDGCPCSDCETVNKADEPVYVCDHCLSKARCRLDMGDMLYIEPPRLYSCVFCGVLAPQEAGHISVSKQTFCCNACYPNE